MSPVFSLVDHKMLSLDVKFLKSFSKLHTLLQTRYLGGASEQIPTTSPVCGQLGSTTYTLLESH